MLHGNGGAHSRFALFMQEYERRPADIRPHLPSLPGFGGRPLAGYGLPSWDPFLASLAETIESDIDRPWVVYGHGIGGSILLEWASRGWSLNTGKNWRPKGVILHGCIGASLEHRLFPRLMRPKWVREWVKQMIAHPALRPMWEKKLFLYPERIPGEYRARFFRDYQICEAFSVFFDLITPRWYGEVASTLNGAAYHFLWGDRERVVASRHLEYWRSDFPHSTFEVIPGWDHFPMLDQPEAFYQKIVQIVREIE